VRNCVGFLGGLARCARGAPVCSRTACARPGATQCTSCAWPLHRSGTEDHVVLPVLRQSTEAPHSSTHESSLSEERGPAVALPTAMLAIPPSQDKERTTIRDGPDRLELEAVWRRGTGAGRQRIPKRFIAAGIAGVVTRFRRRGQARRSSMMRWQIRCSISWSDGRGFSMSSPNLRSQMSTRDLVSRSRASERAK